MGMLRIKLLLCCCLLAVTAPADAAQVRQAVYGPDSAHILDLYTPAEAPSAPLPAVVLAHGGLWHSGSREELAAFKNDLRLAAKVGGDNMQRD